MRTTAILTGAALGLLLFGGAAPAGPAAAAQERAPVLSFDHFYDDAELTRALEGLAKAYPKLMTFGSIGKSVQERDIWGVVLSNAATGPAERKPGYYVDGNIHGNEIQGGEVALYIIDYLLRNHGRTGLATRLLDERAFYIVPTMNPDSRDYYLHRPADSNSPRTGHVPYDEDRDGSADEDGPEDLDGDGSITQMRKKVADGPMKLHPDDPRLLVPVKPGEKGEYVLLGSEGVDNDGDGMINEDGPGGYDMNRNFGYNWQPNYVQQGAGPYPFCWPETRAVRDFILAHPNIAGVQSFHNYGAMILRGPGAANLGDYHPQDIQVYNDIARKGEAILPGYRYVTVHKDMYTVYGGTIDFTYAVLGIFTFSNELDFPQHEGIPRKPGDGEDENVMAAIMGAGGLEELVYQDLVLMGEHFTDWKAYDHPLYGRIEIGGVKKFGRRVPALFRLAETCHRNAAFVLYHADQLARLGVEEPAVRSLGGGVCQVDVKVRNTARTPTIAGIAVQNKLHRPDRVSVAGGRLVAASRLTDEYRGLAVPFDVREGAFWNAAGIPGHGTATFRLLVEGRGAATLVYDSLKGGCAERKMELK